MGPPTPGTNSADAQGYVKRIETLLFEIDRLREAHQEDCKPYRDDIKSIYDEAKDHGVDPKALRAVVRYRGLERKQQKIEDDLDSAERHLFDQLVVQLGDLGRAAAERAGYLNDDAPQATA